MSLIFNHVNYIYNPGDAYEKYALKDVSLTLNDGEFVGIIGHTGSGKSTLTQLMNGLIKATSGEILYNGENIYSKDFKMKELRSHVGLVFQYPEHQLFESTVVKDVAFGPGNLDIPKKEADLRTFEAIKAVGLPDSIYDESPFDLSGGQKRRVAIAGVLAMQPDVLILDEPTAGLDPKGRDEIFEQIVKIHNERHITVVLVSHSMEDVAKYVDRMIVMNQGEVRYDGAPKDIFPYYEELENIGLAAPQVTYVTEKLKSMGKIHTDEVAITVDQALDMIVKSGIKN